MNPQTIFIYKKLALLYAKAFMNVHGSLIDQIAYSNIKNAAPALSRNKRLMFLMQISFADHMAVKRKLMRAIITQFSLLPHFESLFNLLIEKQRAHLVPLVLRRIVQWYDVINNRVECKLTASHPLSAQEIEIIKQKMALLTGKHIGATYTLQKGLIAGVRITSNEYLWECSIRKKLATIKQHFMQR